MRGPSITGDGANQSVPLDRKRRQPGNLLKRGTRSLAPSRFYDLLSHFVSGDAGYLGSLGSALVLPQPTELGSIPDVANGGNKYEKDDFSDDVGFIVILVQEGMGTDLSGGSFRSVLYTNDGWFQMCCCS